MSMKEEISLFFWPDAEKYVFVEKYEREISIVIVR